LTASADLAALPAWAQDAGPNPTTATARPQRVPRVRCPILVAPAEPSQDQVTTNKPPNAPAVNAGALPFVAPVHATRNHVS
jgi:hypothetical protein